MKRLSAVGRSVASAGLFAWFFVGVSTASAASRDIDAVFRADPAKPTDNQFVVTTPISGFCFNWPELCAVDGLSSFMIPVTFDSSSAIQANHPDTRQGAMFKVPGSWRTIQVVHMVTGESEDVSVRIAGVGAKFRLSDKAVDLVGGGVSLFQAHEKLWTGGIWGKAPQPCTNTPVSLFSDYGYEFFWLLPQQDVLCAKQAKYLIPAFGYTHVNFAFDVRTPNPLKMSTGHYKGSLTYGIGPGQDFDMGDVMVANDSQLTLNFNLEVQHTLKVEIPPGGNRVELVPQEGWQSWLNSGRKPTRLFRDQRFHISASSRFKMALECQIISGNTCAISETSTGHVVPVDVSVTLPNGLTDAAGQPVNRRRLLRDGSGTELFQPGVYIDRRSGTLHFEVPRASVEEMLDNDAKAYTGNVTVIWDSEI
ncbi:hypothetical protein [Pseudomonas brassicacearum]|uniref:hypothetical protein n=1 Tax=Pseudomonas brassicacearum TaxID=930166 RepID=UPI001D895000|nr:hypothetical protein [Pseudomonas brassicacearum]CAH0249139.1 hypothetical protein SRABI06_03095 [Pseudomonas brassicacearum]